jgi:hypothetical protein
MKRFLAAGFLLASLVSARAEIVSEYTELNVEQDCTVAGRAAEGDGDWANFVCPGYRGYPVILSYADARESVFYGFPPEGEAGFVWESFEGFNSSGPRIEWRIDRQENSEVPFATIHRWTVSRAEDTETQVEVLVVEKVGLLPERQSCAVGYVVASGNSQANEQARNLADEQARDFSCGDQPSVLAGEEPVPPFSRGEN